MKRRAFLQSSLSAAAAAATLPHAGAVDEVPKSLVIAADPFAIELKDAIKEHLQKKGFSVADVGATKDREMPFFDAAPAAVALIQSGDAERGILLCGTGAGMCIVANKYKGISAVCVESVFSAKMARAINNANIITLGAMIVAPWMANEMVDVWLETKHTEGLDEFSDFLKGACARVEAMDTGQ